MNKKITVQCAHCGELVEIQDTGFYWALCPKCANEYAEDLERDYKKDLEEGKVWYL